MSDKSEIKNKRPNRKMSIESKWKEGCVNVTWWQLVAHGVAIFSALLLSLGKRKPYMYSLTCVAFFQCLPMEVAPTYRAKDFQVVERSQSIGWRHHSALWAEIKPSASSFSRFTSWFFFSYFFREKKRIWPAMSSWWKREWHVVYVKLRSFDLF